MTGFVLVDKPSGPTSHDVVAMIRRALGVRRVGHAGTLDPPATGLVVVGVGPATRLLRFVQRRTKSYATRGRLGVRTSTADAAGEVLSSLPVDVSEDQLRAVLPSLTGEILQVPPAVSAVKVAGVRSYKRAARGEAVELAARPVKVHELQLLAFEPPDFELEVVCSSGTYVRSIVSDIGERLGCGAHVAELRRTAIGDLRVEDAVAPADAGPQHVRPVRQVLTDLPVVELDRAAAVRAWAGQRLPEAAPDGEVLACCDSDTVGVFESREGVLHPVTVLPRPEES
ncbi:MAG TPA: tRNA pseudouridine(55) synthase TruB [Actinomycetota bacterium]|nr:tRNA pseudouridine(55) synthase TruB [Actinomycetota bacterium]